MRSTSGERARCSDWRLARVHRNRTVLSIASNVRSKARPGSRRECAPRANSKLDDGIRVDAAATATLLKRNTANDNGDDGIDIDAPGTTVTRNTANDNYDLGIEALAGVVDGGGNRASNNGNAVECTILACSSPRR
jgi:parallel beta-helix repeat protein